MRLASLQDKQRGAFCNSSKIENGDGKNAKVKVGRQNFQECESAHLADDLKIFLQQADGAVARADEHVREGGHRGGQHALREVVALGAILGTNVVEELVCESYLQQVACGGSAVCELVLCKGRGVPYSL